MRFIGYEIKKILSHRFLTVLFALFLAINAILCFYQTQEQEGQLPREVIADFFEKYDSDPEAFDRAYGELNALLAERRALMLEAMRKGLEYEEEPIPNKYAPEGYNDLQLFSAVYERKAEIENYSATLKRVISSAENNLAEYETRGVSPSSYTYRYQVRVIEKYSSLLEAVEPELEHTRGWSEYFGYSAVNVFIFALLIVVGALVFVQEKQSGALYLIRVSKNGRTKTAVAKLGALAVITAVIVLTFTLETWLIFGASLGYSSFGNAIQAFGTYVLFPYQFTVGEYFAVTVLMKLITFLSFSTLVAAIGVFIYNYVLVYLAGLGVFGVNLAMSLARESSMKSNLGKYVNLVSASSVDGLFLRYRAINVFGLTVNIIYVCLVLLVFVLVLSAIFAVVRYSAGGALGIRVPTKEKKTRPRILPTTIIGRRYTLSVFGSEIHKTLISTGYVVFVVILICAKIFLLDTHETQSYSDGVYEEYMTVLEGEYSEEKREYILKERERISDAINRYESMSTAYANGDISFDEYREYISEYNYAYGRSETFREIEQHARYIDTMASKGREAWFLYDTGWNKLFFLPFDAYFFAAALLLFAGSFAREHGGFSQILRTTKKGRGPTFREKFLVACSLSAILCLICSVLDYVGVFSSYTMTGLDAPIRSIQVFSDIALDVTVGEYLVIFSIVRIFAALVLACLVCALSQMLKKHILVLSACVALTLFPMLLVSFGLDMFGALDFTGFLRATPMLLRNLSGAVYMFVATAITAVSVFWAKKEWGK